jgi:hypothetical protein
MKPLFLSVLVFALVLAGCIGPRPLKPGASKIKSVAPTPTAPAQFESELKQPENPAQSAAQNFERTTETALPLPAGTRVQEKITARNEAQLEAAPTVSEKTIILSAPAVQTTRTVEKAGTVIGAAQKDTAREIGAKLSSLKGIVWVGVAMFLFGLATLFYPPLRAIIGSVTTSAAITVGGLTLMVLPTLIVGNELLILGGVAVAVGGWFLAHRHGELKGKVATSGGSIPAEEA